MVFMVNWKKLGVAAIGLAIGGGFLFGPMFSYMGLVDSGSSNQQQQFNATLPSSKYQEEAFNLNTREQRVLAYNAQTVFINGFYDTPEQKQEMQQLKDLTDEFNGRVYVSLANSTANSDILYRYGLTEFPAVVVIGGNPSHQGGILRTSDSQEVSKEICNAFRKLGSAASQCFN